MVRLRWLCGKYDTALLALTVIGGAGAMVSGCATPPPDYGVQVARLEQAMRQASQQNSQNAAALLAIESQVADISSSLSRVSASVDALSSWQNATDGSLASVASQIKGLGTQVSDLSARLKGLRGIVVRELCLVEANGGVQRDPSGCVGRH